MTTTMFTKTSINKIFNNDSFINLFCALDARWYDEKAYEDINAYAAPIEKAINKIVGCEAFNNTIKMTKRPFGFKWVGPYCFSKKDGSIAIKDAEIQFKIKASGAISWSAKACA